MRSFYASVRHCLVEVASRKAPEGPYGSGAGASDGSKFDDHDSAQTQVTAVSSLMHVEDVDGLFALCHACSQVLFCLFHFFTTMKENVESQQIGSHAAYVLEQALLPLCTWQREENDAYRTCASPVTGELVESLLDLLSWLLIAQNSSPHENPRIEPANNTLGNVQKNSHDVACRLVAVLEELPNGVLYVLHPPSRLTWSQVLTPLRLPPVVLFGKHLICLFR